MVKLEEKKGKSVLLTNVAGIVESVADDVQNSSD